MMSGNKTCNQCSLPETQTNPSLICKNCSCLLHFSCLHNSELPGGLLGDIYFKLICMECSGTGKELITRDKMPWVNVVVLVMYNLTHQTHSSSRRGFFHWKLHICKFIQDKWKFLFTPTFRRKKTWMGMVSSTLTHHNTVFMSGLEQLGEPGWWRLCNPQLLPVQILELRTKKKVESQCTTEQDTIANMELKVESTKIKEEPAWSASSDSNEMYSRAYVEPSATLSDTLFEEEDVDVELALDEGICAPSFTHHMSDSSLVDAMAQVTTPQLQDNSQHQSPNSSRSTTPFLPELMHIKQERFDSDLSDGTSDDEPRPKKMSKLEGINRDDEQDESQVLSCQPMSQFDEVQLLHRLQRAGPLPTAEAKRLLRKLAVRHAKRQQHMPLFNIDAALTGYTDKDPSLGLNVSKSDRVLDRFQTLYHPELTVEQKSRRLFLVKLMGRVEPTSFHSPYTERLLKPYILRDSTVRSPWMQLMSGVMAKANKSTENWKPPLFAPLDYSYVRPQHIAPINSLCREFFWPGIDVSESLQYPDFTCVALYKKLVIGFAFLVPDVAYNESYISFLFVRPEWRHAGIAKFMLYHLIQTCMGKDVTLHVAATNPALMLYQKFGFKVEEFVQDFYEKYFTMESKECRHALFLRLSR